MGNCTSTFRKPAGKKFYSAEYDNDDDEADSLEKPPRFVRPSEQQIPPTVLLLGPISSRLASQGAYFLPTLSVLSSQRPALQILDIGSGSGLLTIDVALALPSAYVTGIDACSAVLSSARAFAFHAGVQNITFQTADAHRLPFPDDHFDVVHTHQALAHFHSPVTAIREMLRVTRPGGKVCIREGDLATARFWPEDQVLAECFNVIRGVHARDGGTVDAGMRLMGWMREAGVKGRRAKGSCSAVWLQSEEERRAYGAHWPARCGGGAFREAAREIGVSAEKLDEYAMAWKRWMEDPEGAFSMMHGEVIVSV